MLWRFDTWRIHCGGSLNILALSILGHAWTASLTTIQSCFSFFLLLPEFLLRCRLKVLRRTLAASSQKLCLSFVQTLRLLCFDSFEGRLLFSCDQGLKAQETSPAHVDFLRFLRDKRALSQPTERHFESELELQMCLR